MIDRLSKIEESERKYQHLFNSIDEGFCIVEMLFDENGIADDYRFLEANNSFGKQTGLLNVSGKTMKELAPRHEQYWFDTYGRIAKTGVPERFEHIAKELGHYYDVYAFRIGKPEENLVAVLFNDISARKKMEDALQVSNEILKATFDSSLEYIQLLKAVRNEWGKIIDFTWELTNKKWNDEWGEMKGKSLLKENPGVIEAGLFEDFISVTETGNRLVREQYYRYAQFDGWFQAAIVKLTMAFYLLRII